MRWDGSEEAAGPLDGLPDTEGHRHTPGAAEARATTEYTGSHGYNAEALENHEIAGLAGTQAGNLPIPIRVAMFYHIRI